MDSLDLLGADSGDAGLHAAAQLGGPPVEADSAEAAEGIRRGGAADELVVPRCALGHHGQLPHAGVHGICLEVSGELVVEAAAALGIRCWRARRAARSEEHTSELQSLRHLVCRLLL